MHNKNKHNLKEWHKSQRLIHTTEFDIQTVRMNSVDLSTSSSELRGEPAPAPPLGDGPTVTVGLLLKTVLYCGDAIASYKQVTATHQSLSLALQARLAKTTLTRLK